MRRHFPLILSSFFFLVFFSLMDSQRLLLHTSDLDDDRSLFSCWFWLLDKFGITKKREWLLQDPELNAERLLATASYSDALTCYYIISMLATDAHRMPVQEVRVPPLAFLCHRPAALWSASPPLPPSTGCALHSAQRIAEIYVGVSCVLCYFSEKDLTALGATLHSAPLREHLLSVDPPLRASYRVSHADGDAVVCKRVLFGSVDEFKEAAAAQERNAVLLLSSCERAFHCFECLLCPVLIMLQAYAEHRSAVDDEAAEVPESVLSQLRDSRCITTPALSSLPPATLRAAVLWYFGAVTRTQEIFHELVHGLASGHRARIVDAVRFLNQVVADEYAYAKKGGLLAAAQTQVGIWMRTEAPALYSYEKKRPVTLADAAAMKVQCSVAVNGFG